MDTTNITPTDEELERLHTTSRAAVWTDPDRTAAKARQATVIETRALLSRLTAELDHLEAQPVTWATVGSIGQCNDRLRSILLIGEDGA